MLKAWAFATSASGLSVSSRNFWAMVPREYDLLYSVWEQTQERVAYMHASIHATLINAHFDVDGVPYTPDDLLGRGDRMTRKAKALQGKMAALRMQKEIMGAKASDTNGLPEWARQLGESRGIH